MSGFQSNNLNSIKNVANTVQQIMQGSMEQQRELPDSFTSRVPQAHTDIQSASTIEDRTKILNDHLRQATVAHGDEIVPTDYAIEFEKQVLNYQPETQEGQD